MRSKSQCFNIVHLAIGFTAGQLTVVNAQIACLSGILYTKWPAKAAVGTFETCRMTLRMSANRGGLNWSVQHSNLVAKMECGHEAATSYLLFCGSAVLRSEIWDRWQ